MTGDDLDAAAQRIADQGRDALLERLRPAFAEAAAAHRDVIELDGEQLEEMVQRAADRADGLQWRRALAAVAMRELGIGLAEALAHPAVERAQELVGAPSYEQSLADIAAAGAGVARPPAPAPAPDVEAAPEHEDEDEHLEDEHLENAPDPGEDEDDDDEPHTFEFDVHDDYEHEDDEEPMFGVLGSFAPGAHDDRGAVTFRATHLDGIRGLGTPEADVRLSFSSRGVEIAPPGEHERVISLRWREVRAIEVPRPRGRIRRRRDEETRLIVRTAHWAATFELPGVDRDEVHSRVTPLHPVR